MMNKKLTASLLCAFLLLPTTNLLALPKQKLISLAALAAAATIAWNFQEQLANEIKKNPEKIIAGLLGVAGIGAGVFKIHQHRQAAPTEAPKTDKTE